MKDWIFYISIGLVALGIILWIVKISKAIIWKLKSGTLVVKEEDGKLVYTMLFSIPVEDIQKKKIIWFDVQKVRNFYTPSNERKEE